MTTKNIIHYLFICNLIKFLIKYVYSIKNDFDCSLAKWGAWRCEGDEDICTGLAHRYKCVGGDCVENSPCANIPGYSIDGDCNIVKGLCQAWWGQWGAWSKCSATCGYMERKRFRPCTGVALKHAIPKTCRDPEYVSSLLIGTASTQSNACFLKRLCPRVHGGWSSWGKFSACSVTCGIGEMRRKRLCNNPEPIGGGMVCTGIDTDAAECDSKRPCPSHGSWCKWDPIVQCSKLCGGGSGIKIRRCECPVPQFGGIECYGDNNKYDICNTDPCPYKPDLTASEKYIIFDDLSSYIQSDQWLYSNGGQIPQLGDVIVLQCPKHLKSRRKVFDVLDRFPKKESFWIFNKTKLNDSESYFTDDEFLVIRGLNRDNVGFYSFVYIRDPGEDHDIVCFFSVYLSDDVLEIVKDQDLHLHCNAIEYDAFTKIISLGEWESSWQFDPDEKGVLAGSRTENYLWKSTPKEADFYLSDHRILEEVDEKVSGTFTCSVINVPLNKPHRIFITQQIRVVILPEPTFWEEIGKFMLSHIWSILTILGVSFIMALFLIVRFRQEANWHVITGGNKPVKSYEIITPM